MKFLLDENVEYRIAAFLKKHGHDVTAIAHDYPNALTDRAVLAIAAAEKRILITNDRTDFASLFLNTSSPTVALLSCIWMSMILRSNKNG